MYEEDFVDETPVAFEVNGRKFKYKPLTAKDQNEMLKDFFYVDSKGKMQKNLSALNKHRTMNLVSVPYIKDSEWIKMSKEERFELIGKINPSIFTKIIEQIDKIEKQGSDALKKSSSP